MYSTEIIEALINAGYSYEEATELYIVYQSKNDLNSLLLLLSA